MDFTIENVCGFLIRSRLMTADEMRAMYQRWADSRDGRESGADLGRFSRWLVANHYVTDYQAGLLTKGHAEPEVYFLNQYRILDRLGRGRMAGVYKAVHALGQTVAIKVLPPSQAKNAQMLGRFQREARLSLKLKHPNVVRSFQVGEASGLNYLVMEFLEGETLEEVLERRKRLPPHEAVRVIHQALLGLQHIHEQGMVHRDLKPANLMLLPAAEKGRPDDTLNATVKILDIGLGRELFEESPAPEGGNRLELTAEGVLLGTPDYLAPEQARDPRNIDIRADIYSLGCVLYHGLTGQPPFPDRNVLSQMVRHATEPAKPLQEFNPAIPDGLQQIMNWMLAKQADQRYPTPERAAQALQVFLLADKPQPKAEEPAPMQNYLTWLEMGGPAEVLTPQIVEPAPLATAPTVKPPSVPVAAPAVNNRKRQKPRPAMPDKSSGKPRNEPGAGPRVVDIPMAKPFAAPPPMPVIPGPPKALAAEEFDVELVPMPLSANIPQIPTSAAMDSATATSWLGLSTREWMLIGIGAGVTVGIALVVVVIWALVSSSS